MAWKSGTVRTENGQSMWERPMHVPGYLQCETDVRNGISKHQWEENNEIQKGLGKEKQKAKNNHKIVRWMMRGLVSCVRW